MLYHVYFVLIKYIQPYNLYVFNKTVLELSFKKLNY